jgi:2-keto-3-deoxy-L-rhamnonate aldolase RhmA
MRPTGYFGSWAAFRETPLASPFAGVLIEDPVGVANVEEILSTGVDLVWFGPFDFQVASGLDSRPLEERNNASRRALLTVATASRASGTVMAAVAWDAAAAADVMSLGATLIVMTSDLWLFHEHCRNVVTAVREGIES